MFQHVDHVHGTGKIYGILYYIKNASNDTSFSISFDHEPKIEFTYNE